MNNYVKPVIVTLLTVIVIWPLWDVSCFFHVPPQPMPTRNQKTGSSSSFIQQETNAHLAQSDKQMNPNAGQPISENPQCVNNKNCATIQSTRDYVNPNYQNSGGTLSVSNQPIQSGVGANRGAVRDYVNPSFSSARNTSQQFRPNPRSVQNNNQKPKESFPPLPNSNLNQQFQPTTQISYANKVFGGVTTKSPVGISIPSSTGQPGSSTTEKPNEGPTDNELREFSENLLRRDTNNAAKYVTVNVQQKTTSQSKTDVAPEKLLIINSEAFNIPTVSKLKSLHDNYILATNENEYVSPNEKIEENDFLDSVLSTDVMQYTKNFLISKGKLSRNPKEFKDLLRSLWFNLYSRGKGKIGSSGFEHVFLAELKGNEVSGMHNWLYFDNAELRNIVNYLGYMKKVDFGEKGSVLKFHFTLNGVDKPVGSMFIGTSPELELALYTTCYVFRADRICPLKFNGQKFIIRTYTIRYRSKNLIGSAFPEI